MSNNGNGRQPWRDPMEVHRSLMPSTHNPHEDLFRDVVLRLEKTPPSKALMYPFDSVEATHTAARSIAVMFARRIGKNVIEVKSAVNDDGTPVLFVARGENYVK